ncbi:Integrase [Lachnospiraceae bacterium KM106-2]|nr:Integrase [Lachnospiraceae bacterium KM106-2]
MGKDLKGKELGKGIVQRPDGRYMARYTDRFGRRRTIYNDKLRDLKRSFEEAVYKDMREVNGNGINITLNEWFEIWLETYKVNKVSPKTIYKNRSYYNSRVKGTLGCMYLKKIKLIDVQKLINGLFDVGLGYNTIANIRTLLSEIMNKAVANDYILKNPCKGIAMPKKVIKESRVLTKEEQKIFFNYAENYAHINLLKFEVTTGCRIGEVLGLKWDDIDFEERKLTIKRNLNYSKALQPDEGSKFYFGEPKNEYSKRTFYVRDEVYNILQNQKQKQLQMRLRKGDLWNKNKEWEGLVFTTVDGRPINYGNIREAIFSIVEQINMVEIEMAKQEGRKPKKFENLSTHTFRHTFSTRCLEHGVKPEVRDAILGHSLGGMLGIYTHVTFEEIKSETENLWILRD